MQTDSRVADFLSRLVVLMLVLAGLAGVFGWYLPLIQDNQRLRQEIAQQELRIQGLREEINALSLRLVLSQEDPETVERLARENLGYAAPGETIVRFEDRRPGNPPVPGR